MKRYVAILFIIFGFFFQGKSQCSYTLELNDSDGDGWTYYIFILSGRNAYVDVTIGDGSTTSYTLGSGSTGSVTIDVAEDDSVTLEYRIVSDSYTYENSWRLYNANDTPINHADGTQEASYTLYCHNQVLPIQLLNFNIDANDNTVYLSWITATETNNDYFIIERSSNGIDFKAIQQTDGAGNSDTKQYYTAIDDAPYQGTSYYRLKQVDFDGKISYSDIKTVEINKITDYNKLDFIVYPNPTNTQQEFTIKVSNFDKNTSLSITDISGKIIVSNYNIETNNVKFDRNLLPQGIYIINITNKYSTISKKLIVQ